MTALRASELPRRPELEWLDEPAKQRVLRVVRMRGVRCSGCGRRSFSVGDALYLGFLFENAEQDEYMVGLVCRNRLCPAPRTGVRLRASEFLRSPRG